MTAAPRPPSVICPCYFWLIKRNGMGYNAVLRPHFLKHSVSINGHRPGGNANYRPGFFFNYHYRSKTVCTVVNRFDQTHLDLSRSRFKPKGNLICVAWINGHCALNTNALSSPKWVRWVIFSKYSQTRVYANVVNDRWACLVLRLSGFEQLRPQRTIRKTIWSSQVNI